MASCASICVRVLQRCPYYVPNVEYQYSGMPVFDCNGWCFLYYFLNLSCFITLFFIVIMLLVFQFWLRMWVTVRVVYSNEVLILADVHPLFKGVGTIVLKTLGKVWAGVAPMEKQNFSRRKSLKSFSDYISGQNLVCTGSGRTYNCKSLWKTKLNKNLSSPFAIRFHSTGMAQCFDCFKTWFNNKRFKFFSVAVFMIIVLQI